MIISFEEVNVMSDGVTLETCTVCDHCRENVLSRGYDLETIETYDNGIDTARCDGCGAESEVL